MTDVHDGIETLLDPAAFRIEGRYLRRLSGTWGEWTTVAYAPTDDSAVRPTVLVQLCQLETSASRSMVSYVRLEMVVLDGLAVHDIVPVAPTLGLRETVLVAEQVAL